MLSFNQFDIGEPRIAGSTPPGADRAECLDFLSLHRVKSDASVIDIFCLGIKRDDRQVDKASLGLSK